MSIGVWRMQKYSSSNQVKELFNQWSSKYIYSTSNGKYVNGSQKGQTPTAISEAQGYGMILTVQAAKKGWSNQKTFNQLVTYYLKHRISRDNHLMSWKQIKKGNAMFTLTDDKVNATDGDLDIAYSLYQADTLWGSDGSFNYRQIADQILHDLLKFTYKKSNSLLVIGNWALNSKKYENLVRTSDLIPAYYRYFYKKTKDTAWLTIERKSELVLRKLSAQNKTGLLPDFAIIDKKTISPAPAYSLEGKNDGHYAWNATRTPWRLALGNSNTTQNTNRKMLNFFKKQTHIRAVYTLSGKPLTNYGSMAFTAPIAVAANQQSKDFNTLAVSTKKMVLSTKLTGNYYADTLQVLAAFYIVSMEE
ncbi:glycosyl hydrolase family 8 [Liquorilactobacillus uvarum]|nr:glycosyl hydrolase family 8 [Liquorilactobacillus uvarum]